MPPGAERLFVVDAHSLIFQVFHAIREPMTSPAGLPTNALFGFARDLLFLRQRKPDYLIVAFDRSEVTFRNEIYKEYKAHRSPTPSDLEVQLPHMPRLTEALSLPTMSIAGFEADDILATLSRAASAKDIDVYLCTSDKDCRQLPRRPRALVQHAETPGIRAQGTARRLGRAARSGGRFPVPGRR